MEQASVRSRQTVDALFAAGLVASLLLGGKVTPLLIIFGVLPIPFLAASLKEQKITTPVWRILAPSAAYFIYGIFTLMFFTGLEENSSLPVNPSLEFYLVAISMLLIGSVRGLQILNMDAFFRTSIPTCLLIAFVILSYLMFAGIRTDCRVEALAPWPFIPALIFSTISLLSLAGWEQMTRRERLTRLALLAFSIVVTTAYTGSRGVAVGLLVAFFVLFVSGLSSKLRGRVPRWHDVLLAGFFGVGLSFAVGVVTECGPVKRFATTFHWSKSTVVTQLSSSQPSEDLPGEPAASHLNVDPEAPHEGSQPTGELEAPRSDKSIDIRIEMWRVSLDAIYESPLWGHGSLYMHKLIGEPYGFQHNHNQYLSWLVTGGLIQLLLGLVFLATPWIVSVRCSFADRILIAVAMPALWGAAMMFDSFFNLKFYMHFYCLLCGLIYAWTGRQSDNLLRVDGRQT